MIAWLMTELGSYVAGAGALLALILGARIKWTRDGRKAEREQHKEDDDVRADEITRRVDAARRGGLHPDDDERGWRD